MIALPSLEDVEDAAFRIIADVLGETVQYAHDGAAFATVKAAVEYGEARRDAATGIFVEQAMAVSVLKVDLPGYPGKSARLRFSRHPGVTYKPSAVIEETSGAHWTIEVERA